MIIGDNNFQKEYAGLNKAQKEAVDSIEGPVMVIAGPGTGKTHILALRVANILRLTDTEPEQILALTFTEAGAFAMRERLTKIIGGAAHRLNVWTFHGFCNEVIRRFEDHFPRIAGGRVASELERIQVVRKAIDDLPLNKLRPFGDRYNHARPILSQISELKRENVDPVRLSELLDKEEAEVNEMPDLMHESGKYKGTMKGKYKDALLRIEKNRELGAIYEEYERSLRAKKLFDFDDMILEVVRALKSDDELLSILREEYQYILADEHQDANGAQNEVLFAIASFFDRPNLFVVGDAKQAIYRFQGASIGNFLSFAEAFTDVKVIAPTENYRSLREVLEPAHALIEKSRLSGESAKGVSFVVPLVPVNKIGGEEIEIHSYQTIEEEAVALANSVKKLVDSGESHEEIVILLRKNKYADLVSEWFSRFAIPHCVGGDKYIWKDVEIKKLFTLLRATSKMSDDDRLFQALACDYFQIRPMDLWRAARFAFGKRMTFFEVVSRENLLKEAGVTDMGVLEIGRTLSLLEKWSVVGRNKTVSEMLETVVRESGMIEYVLRQDDGLLVLEKLREVYKLFDSLVPGENDSAVDFVVNSIALLEEYELSVGGQKGLPPGRVRILTAHGSKGLEFNHVFVPFVYEGNWGGGRDMKRFHIAAIHGKEENESEEDERRLLYVALTRARKHVHLSLCADDSGRKKMPSRFIEDMKASTIAAGPENEDVFVSKIMHEKVAFPVSEDKAYLRDAFLKDGLSVTALNNYLECPWKFFFLSLIRVPKGRDKSATFGTAMHSALERYLRSCLSGKDEGVAALLGYFEKAVHDSPLRGKEEAEVMAEGKRCLEGYHAEHSGKWPSKMELEYKIRGVEFPISSGSINLLGNIDRMDIFENGEVAVYDYKTAEPKSRNEIEGKTQNSNGDYKRQLVFYRLLLDGIDKYKMRSAAIDFLKPDDRGRYKCEEFMIGDGEITELKNVIGRVSKEILNFDFWDKSCGEKDCEWCKMRRS